MVTDSLLPGLSSFLVSPSPAPDGLRREARSEICWKAELAGYIAKFKIVDGIPARLLPRLTELALDHL